MQTFVPTWVAPNLITLLGLFFPLASLAVFAWTAPGFQEEPPRWAFFFNAFALFAYQTLDNMDGKQARRTGMSNALGMVGGVAWFDGGCEGGRIKGGGHCPSHTHFHHLKSVHQHRCSTTAATPSTRASGP